MNAGQEYRIQALLRAVLENQMVIMDALVAQLQADENGTPSVNAGGYHAGGYHANQLSINRNDTRDLLKREDLEPLSAAGLLR